MQATNEAPRKSSIGKAAETEASEEIKQYKKDNKNRARAGSTADNIPGKKKTFMQKTFLEDAYF